MSREISLILIVLILIVMLFNRKVCLIRLFILQIRTFRNDRTDKCAPWDLMCFIVFPIIVSALIVFGLSYQVDANLAETLTTVFSIVFTVLFGFAAVIVEKSESENLKKKRVVSETFVSIVTSTVLSLLAAIVSILLTRICATSVVSILSFVLLFLSFSTVMLLLMITKRTFVIYCESE